MKLYNGAAIIAGLVVFVGLVSYPFWTNIGDKAYEQPELKLPPEDKATECVEDTQWMRENHMQLLDDWRDAVVREGKRIYVSKTNHKEYVMSLQEGCMKCHETKTEFCDKCHDTASVSPYCWDCHVAPKEEN
jgi:hypothetical protein